MMKMLRFFHITIVTVIILFAYGIKAENKTFLSDSSVCLSLKNTNDAVNNNANNKLDRQSFLYCSELLINLTSDMSAEDRHKYLWNTLRTASNLYKEQNKFNEAEKLLLELYKNIGDMSNEKKKLPLKRMLYSKLGQIYLKQNAFKKAELTYLKMIKLYDHFDQNNMLFLGKDGIDRYWLAEAYVGQKMFKKAISTLKISKNEMIEVCGKTCPFLNKVYMLEEMIYLSISDNKLADISRSSYTTLDFWLADYDSALEYEKRGIFSQSNKLLSSLQSQLESSVGKDSIELIDILEDRIRIAKKMGNYREVKLLQTKL